jgi:hypothetical protein
MMFRVRWIPSHMFKRCRRLCRHVDSETWACEWTMTLYGFLPSVLISCDFFMLSPRYGANDKLGEVICLAVSSPDFPQSLICVGMRTAYLLDVEVSVI